MTTPPPQIIAQDAVESWFAANGRTPFDFQRRAWDAYLSGKSGLIHATTGVGKTHAAWIGPLIEWISANPDARPKTILRPPDSPKRGDAKRGRDQSTPLTVLWLTPLRALAADTREALQSALDGLSIPWSLELRTGDTSATVRQRQRKRLPTALITTPESLSLLISYAGAEKQFADLRAVIVDEWHELIGSKRGVMAELLLARLRRWRPGLRVWGLSATLGNTETAMRVLLGPNAADGALIEGVLPKRIEIRSVIPETHDAAMERFPWAGHLGLRLLDRMVDWIETSRSTLVFTNTRSQCEIWYQALLDARPDWAGAIALHHGSLEKETREVVEAMLRDGRLQCVVCTSSLDLGVDFSPVDQVVQVGSPKGVARFMQRAGRSGHRPGEISRILCVPTHALELMEIAAVRAAIAERFIEPRTPVRLPLDLLTQHLVTLALGDGFDPDAVFEEVRTTSAFEKLTREAFGWALDFVSRGGDTLSAYDEFARVRFNEGRFRVEDKAIARRHRMSIGTITGDAALWVRYQGGGRLGTIEERFISRLKRGDIFVFAGRVLEFLRIKEMTVWVRNAKRKTGPVPQWLGGKMPLSTQLSAAMRRQLSKARDGVYDSPEAEAARPLLELQARWSAIPGDGELLIERLKTRDGHHLFVYPFEGRFVNEGLAALFAFRISRLEPITISVSLNDYGFELLSDREIPAGGFADGTLFDTERLVDDVLASLNASEMARRQFREIARIAGLVFQGYPGSRKTNTQIQASASLLYNLFHRYDPENLLLKQAEREVLEQQLDIERLRQSLARMAASRTIQTEPPHPTPLGFPILVDRLRTRVSSETLADRVRKMQVRLEKAAGKKSPR